MRVLTLATVGAALLFSGNKSPQLKGKIGLSQGKKRVSVESLKSEVTFSDATGVPHFIDSVAVGVLRGLRSHLVVSDVGGVIEVAVPLDGSAVKPSISAYRYVEQANLKGQYVLAPLSAGFDLPVRRILVLSNEPPMPGAEGAMDADLIVLLPPKGASVFRSAVFNPETGG